MILPQREGGQGLGTGPGTGPRERENSGRKTRLRKIVFAKSTRAPPAVDFPVLRLDRNREREIKDSPLGAVRPNIGVVILG